MRYLAFAALFLSLCLAALCEETFVPITDNSEPGSPLSNTGTATLSETVVDGGMEMHHTEQWKARNVSSKAIMAVVETLRVHYANGANVTEQFEHETFFYPQTVMPDKEIDFTSAPPITSTRTTHVTPSIRKANCEVIVRWVQFDDGTIFGDPKYASSLLRTRAEVLKQLRRLQRVYSTEGPEQFAAQLQQRTDSPADGHLEHIRMVLRRDGTQAAIDALGKHLQAAESRTALLSQ